MCKTTSSKEVVGARMSRVWEIELKMRFMLQSQELRRSCLEGAGKIWMISRENQDEPSSWLVQA
ncbi:rCG27489 [Rattus norvegicus]|uniref:RCG27489 n=1 Tax=Rattus norvegicus TaxID=10116 RepID=A6K795_RAT|nr:rCG27489 [Rattus norvegicus]